jgi:hypothetical protein
LIVERILVRIEHVVHFPELVVRGRRLRNLGGVLSVGMHLGQRKVPKDEPEGRRWKSSRQSRARGNENPFRTETRFTGERT